MKIPYEKILILTILVLFQNCIKPNHSKFLPLASSSVKPYTQEDLGLIPPPAESQQASLPVISERENKAIQGFLKDVQDLELMSDQGWQMLSVEAMKTIQFAPLTDNELNDKIFREMRGETIPEKIAGSNAVLLEKESKAADEFFGKIEKDFPFLSDQELINIRQNLTVSLVAIRMQMDFGDDVNGIPDEFLLMVREKTVGLRMKITEELLKRGVTSI